MKIKPNALAGGLITGLLLSPLVFAHHSFAVHFLPDPTVKVTGVVESFKFTNPHGVLEFKVVDEAGNEVQWKAETNSPNVLRRRGWSKEAMKPGDRITVEGFPARNEANYMRISHVVLADGSELFAQAKAD